MGLFDHFERTNPIQAYMDGFFGNMAIVDVVACSDIQIMKINGYEQWPHADTFFSDHATTSPTRINSFDQALDAIFWIFDTFLVLELGAKSDTRQFIVMQPVNLQHSYNGRDGFKDSMDAMESAIKILGLKEQLNDPMMELIVFKEVIDFLVDNTEQVVAILKKKYS